MCCVAAITSSCIFTVRSLYCCALFVCVKIWTHRGKEIDMRKLKKALSLLLIGVIAITSLFCGTVVTGAEDKKFADPVFKVFLAENYYVGVVISYDDAVFDYFKELKKDSKTSDVVLPIELVIGDYKFYIAERNGTSTEYGVTNTTTNSNLPLKDYKVERHRIQESEDAPIYMSYYFWFKNTSTVGKAILDRASQGTLIPISYRYALFSLSNSKTYYGSDSTSFHNFITFNDYTVSSPKDISSLSFSKISNQTYTGKEIKPSVTVKDGDKVLTKGTDYGVMYDDNEDIGTAKITFFDDNEFYTGEKEIEFKIVPAKTTLTAKKSGSKYTLSWKAVKGDITKYQIQYSTDGGKTFKSAGTVSAKKTSTSLKLDTGKSYTFRIRSYKTVDGKKYYSEWSKAVTVK